MKSGYTYIMTNKRHTVLYVGCTIDLARRVAQHKSHFYKGSFTDRYNCEQCVYYESFPDFNSAIRRENQMKNSAVPRRLRLLRR